MIQRIFSLIILASVISSCELADFTKKADLKIAVLTFKNAISNIELYKIRHGYYPVTLDSLEFFQETEINFGSLNYKRLENGYKLFITVPFANDTLNYPKEFWKGLGIKETNVIRYTK